MLILAKNTLGTMSAARQRPLWEAFLKSPCYAKMAPVYQDWLQLLAHTAARDAPAMAPVGERMLARAAMRTRNQASLLLTATVPALLANGEKDRAQALIAQHWANYDKAAYEWPTMDMLFKVARAR